MRFYNNYFVLYVEQSVFSFVRELPDGFQPVLWHVIMMLFVDLRFCNIYKLFCVACGVRRAACGPWRVACSVC